MVKGCNLPLHEVADTPFHNQGDDYHDYCLVYFIKSDNLPVMESNLGVAGL